MCEKIVPNLFIIGAPKSGTTAFVASLSSHPDIFVPPVKEPTFFDAGIFYDLKEEYPIKNQTDYLVLYESNEAKVSSYRVDGSVFVMYSSEAIDEILKMCPEAKFIVLLRDPVSAVKSMFAQRMKNIQTNLREINNNFYSCWDLSLERHNNKNYPKGCKNKFIFRYDLMYSYEKYLPYLEEKIESKNFLILSYKDYKMKPEIVLDRVVSFLGINSKEELTNEFKNVSYQEKPTILASLLLPIIFLTTKFRVRIGLTQKNFPLMKNLFHRKEKATVWSDSKKDEEIKEFFSDTYKYLDSKGIDF